MTKLRATQETIVLMRDYLGALNVRAAQFDWVTAVKCAQRIKELADELWEVLEDENVPQGEPII